MDRKFLFLVAVFFLVLGTFATAVFYDQSTTLRARADNKCEPAISKSFTTSFPKTVSAGEQCEVNVFVRCEDESAVIGAQVQLDVANGSVDLPEGTTTDEGGRAVFNVTPEGLATINATVNGSLPLTGEVTCSSE